MQVTNLSNKHDLANDETQLRSSCQQMESYFWSQLLAAMDKTIPDDGILGDSFAKNVYQDMLNQQYALVLARQGSRGRGSLSDILYRQLGGK